MAVREEADFPLLSIHLICDHCGGSFEQLFGPNQPDPYIYTSSLAAKHGWRSGGDEQWSCPRCVSKREAEVK
jgi:hypothetical protein